MTQAQWNAFSLFRTNFKKQCEKWAALSEELYPLQRDAASKDTPPYPQETAVVYNTALDTLTAADNIHLIVIGDNPGKEEQLAANRKYLVGQSGRIAEGFFRRNPELNTDFRKNVIILNKTPIHTAKTAHLRYLANSSPKIKALISESQLWMAEATACLHKQLVLGAEAESSFIPQLWLVGYAELKGKNGLFLPYRDCLKQTYFESNDKAWDEVFVYQHFSMNRFLIDLKAYRKEHPSLSLRSEERRVGKECRSR